jgi:hypothetical protein
MNYFFNPGSTDLLSTFIGNLERRDMVDVEVLSFLRYSEYYLVVFKEMTVDA